MHKGQKIPVSVLTGFLGSGKTTVLNRLLRHPDMATAMVIINEFGEIGLDHELVESATDDMVLLQSGCLCCTVRSDLIEAFQDLLGRRDRGEIGPFERVIIETTGIAEPAPILQVLVTDPRLARRLCVDGVITTVDAAAGGATLDRYRESVDQVALADRILLTKTDLVDADRARAIEARLEVLNPTAPIIRTVAGEITPDQILEVGLRGPATGNMDIQRWLGADQIGRAHDHDHTANRHDDHIVATCLVLERPIPGEALDEWLRALFLFKGPSLLRFKAIVNVAELEGPVVLHGVQHVIHPPVLLESWPGDDRRTRMVFITHDMDGDTLRRSLQEVVGDDVMVAGG